MISDKDRKKLKHLPHRSSGLINSKLEQLGFKSVSATTISNVLNGNWENLEVEQAIYAVNHDMLQLKKQIKNPGAVTPGLQK